MQWKGGNQCAVLLSFDVDGRHMWVARAKRGLEGFDKPTHISTGDYGVNEGVPRVLDLLDKYGIQTGFFIPGLIAEENPDVIGDIHDAGHEIANHSLTHIPPSELSSEEQRRELVETNEILREITGESPVGYRAPIADVTEETLDLLTELGFEYESSLRSWDTPYAIDTANGELVELPLHWTGDDAAFFNFSAPESASSSGMSSPAKVYDIWTREFDVCYEEGLLMVLACHPQVIGRPNRIHMFEEFLQYVLGHPDVWVAKPRDIATYWRREQ